VISDALVLSCHPRLHVRLLESGQFEKESKDRPKLSVSKIFGCDAVEGDPDFTNKYQNTLQVFQLEEKRQQTTSVS